MKIGIIREGKTPPDARVPLTPHQVKDLISKGIDVVVQPSNVRAYSDAEYRDAGCILKENLADRDVLLGVKEIPVDMLLTGKTYFFFSHTIKEQPYNQKLLKACIDKKITLVDYEVITDDRGQRLIAFGKFAGMVGAHNALWTWGKRTGDFDLPRMYTIKDYKAAKEIYTSMTIPPLKIVLTGTGRVANGAAQVLTDMGIKKVTPLDYVTHEFLHPVFTQINSFFYAKRKDGQVIDDVKDFFMNPLEYESDFRHFLPFSDIMINGIYWDNNAPAFFTKEQMQDEDFKIKVIADVTCDIAPISSIPSTLEASTIMDPVFGYDRFQHKKTKAFQENTVDMMTIDNLPNEMPRDASEAFGQMYLNHVFSELIKEDSEIIERATICRNGKLGLHFKYLKNYLEKT
jgi:alanine dehydrogenase